VFFVWLMPPLFTEVPVLLWLGLVWLASALRALLWLS
jgi:hypothetical protein